MAKEQKIYTGIHNATQMRAGITSFLQYLAEFPPKMLKAIKDETLNLVNRGVNTKFVLDVLPNTGKLTKEAMEALVTTLQDHTYSKTGTPKKVLAMVLLGKEVGDVMKRIFHDENAGLTFSRAAVGAGDKKAKAPVAAPAPAPAKKAAPAPAKKAAPAPAKKAAPVAKKK